MIATVDNIKSVRPISENIDATKRIQPYILEVENLIIRPALGALKYKNIEANKTDVANKLILEGGYYDGDTKYLNGLYQAIGYLAYSRLVRNNNVNVTAFGVSEKLSQFSDKVDEKVLLSVANDAEKVGKQYLNECLEYLQFDDSENKIYNKRFGSRIKAIGD